MLAHNLLDLSSRQPLLELIFWCPVLVSGHCGPFRDHVAMDFIYEVLAISVWTSCQIHKIAGAHAPGMPGTFFPVTAGKRSRLASRHVRYARAVMHARIAN